MNPMNTQSAIAESILACKPLAARYFAGFDERTRVAQPPGLPNHLAWCLGHLAHTMHRVAEKFDGQQLPASDIAPAPTPGAFFVEDVCFGSAPTADPARYPSLARCIQIFDAACDRLGASVRALPDARLEEMHSWGKGQTTLREIASRMVFHNGVHIGQIADLRRALGFKSIFA
jgi:hypothetical protein